MSASSLGYCFWRRLAMASISARACACAHVRLEASDRKEAVVVTAEIGFCVAHRHPELAWTAPELPLEIARHYAHYREVRAVHADGPAHQRWIAAVAPLPQSITQDDLVISPESFFFGKESAAEKRLHAQALRRSPQIRAAPIPAPPPVWSPRPRGYSPGLRNRRSPWLQKNGSAV